MYAHNLTQFLASPDAGPVSRDPERAIWAQPDQHAEMVAMYTAFTAPGPELLDAVDLQVTLCDDKLSCSVCSSLSLKPLPMLCQLLWQQSFTQFSSVPLRSLTVAHFTQAVPHAMLTLSFAKGFHSGTASCLAEQGRCHSSLIMACPWSRSSVIQAVYQRSKASVRYHMFFKASARHCFGELSLSGILLDRQSLCINAMGCQLGACPCMWPSSFNSLSC